MSGKPILSKYVWDRFLAHTSPQSFFCSWQWGEVEKQMGHTLYRLGWYIKGELTAIAQICVLRAKRGSILTLRHGPVVRGNDAELYGMVLADMKDLARAQSCDCIRMSPLVTGAEFCEFAFKNGAFEYPIHGMDAQRCIVLSLSQPEDKLLSGMRKSTRYDLKKAKKMGVTVSREQDDAALSIFLRLYEKTALRHNFVPHSGIEAEFSVFRQEKSADIFLAKYEESVIAGALIVYEGKQGIYRHGASISGPIPAAALVQWEAIVRTKERGLLEYNFWGVSPENNSTHPWHGLSQFKRGFGGVETVYGGTYDFPVTPRYSMIHILDWYKKVSKKY